MPVKSLLPGVWEVPDKIKRRLGQRAGRQRVIFEEGHLLLILHQLPRPDQAERVPSLFWRKPDGQWLSDQAGSGLGSLENHIESFSKGIDQCEQDEIKAFSANEYFSVLDRITPIHRTASHTYQVLRDARKLVSDDRDLINLRDRAYDNERRSELLYNGTKNSLDFAVARRAEEQAASSKKMAVAAHRLNLMAAFFFPLATIASVLGVNLKHGLESANAPWGFLVFLAVGLLSGILMTTVILSNPTRKADRNG